MRVFAAPGAAFYIIYLFVPVPHHCCTSCVYAMHYTVSSLGWVSRGAVLLPSAHRHPHYSFSLLLVLHIPLVHLTGFFYNAARMDAGSGRAFGSLLDDPSHLPRLPAYTFSLLHASRDSRLLIHSQHFCVPFSPYLCCVSLDHLLVSHYLLRYNIISSLIRFGLARFWLVRR